MIIVMRALYLCIDSVIFVLYLMVVVLAPCWWRVLVGAGGDCMVVVVVVWAPSGPGSEVWHVEECRVSQ